MMQHIYRFSFTKLSRIQDARRGAKKIKKKVFKMHYKFVPSDTSKTATTMKLLKGKEQNGTCHNSQVQEHVKYCSKNFQIIKVLTVERVYHSSRLEKKKKNSRHQSCNL